MDIDKIKQLSEDNSAIDFNHVMFLYGAVISLKPKRCLNLGIGRGTSAFAIFEGLEYNTCGSLDCLDNFYDLNGNLVISTVDELRQKGATIIKEDERNYVTRCEANTYDLILSDADHLHADQWIDDIFRIAMPNAFLFFHDIISCDFPNLYKYVEVAQQKDLPHFLFHTSSRREERCDKSGFLFIINKK